MDHATTESECRLKRAMCRSYPGFFISDIPDGLLFTQRGAEYWLKGWHSVFYALVELV